MKKFNVSKNFFLNLNIIIFPFQWGSNVMAKTLLKLIFFIKQSGFILSSSTCVCNMSSQEQNLGTKNYIFGFWVFFLLLFPLIYTSAEERPKFHSKIIFFNDCLIYILIHHCTKDPLNLTISSIIITPYSKGNFFQKSLKTDLRTEGQLDFQSC